MRIYAVTVDSAVRAFVFNATQTSSDVTDHHLQINLGFFYLDMRTLSVCRRSSSDKSLLATNGQEIFAAAKRQSRQRITRENVVSLVNVTVCSNQSVLPEDTPSNYVSCAPGSGIARFLCVRDFLPHLAVHRTLRQNCLDKWLPASLNVTISWTAKVQVFLCK